MNQDILTSDRFQRDILKAANKCNKLKEKTVIDKLKKVLRKYDSLMSYSLETKNHFYHRFKELLMESNSVKPRENNKEPQILYDDEKYNERNIYAIDYGGTIFKYYFDKQDGSFSLTSMDNSHSYLSYGHREPQHAFRECMKLGSKIYIFRNQKDFFQWALTICK